MKRDAAAEQQALFSALSADPRAHDFFAVLRRVEALHPEWPRFGQALRPAHEALRLGQAPELDFAPAALAGFEAGSGPAPRLSVRFFGLLGPNGPMPLHLTEYARERLRAKGDPTLARFLDVFHHRLLSLFYRAWAQGQPAVQHDRPAQDRYRTWLGASFGLDNAGRGAGPVPDNARLHQAGLLSGRSRHPEGLGKLLAQYFGVPVRIEEHVAQWLMLAEEDRSRLGSGGSARLGVSATSGSKVYDRQFKFRLRVGPLSLAQYQAFLPQGSAWPALRSWVQQYAGLDLAWDLQLVLARAEIPEPRLRNRLRLGVTAWLGRQRRGEDRGDLHIRPDTSFLLRPLH